MSEKELDFKEDYGAFFTASRPRRGADRRLSRTSWIGITSTAVLLVCLLLTPLGCIMADNLGNLRQFFGIDVYRFSRQNYPDVTVTVKSSIVINDKTLRIVLLGDSLVNRPCSFHNLKEKIQADLSQFDYTFDIINCGFDGSKVSNMRLAPLNNCTLPANPHAVIMFWDSDVANVAERFSTDDEISQMRETYVVNVEFVVTTLLEKGEAFMKSNLWNFQFVALLYC